MRFQIRLPGNRFAGERRAEAFYESCGQSSGQYVCEWIGNALRRFKEAEQLRPAGAAEPILHE